MNFRCALGIGCAFLLSLRPIYAVTIEGVTLAPQVSVAGKTLSLNGTALRSFQWGPVDVKIYVASFYAPKALRTSAVVEKSHGPLQFNFTFLRNVGQGQVTQAWNGQFKSSVSFTYDGLAADQARFVSFFGPVRTGRVETVNLVGTDTQVIDGGVLKGTIPGRNFQRAFLSLWFGSKPVTAGLEAALLGVR